MSWNFDDVVALATAVWERIEPEILGAIPGTPPPVLYHYTDANGLLGVLGRHQLWATHHAFLNDPDEGLEFRRVCSAVADASSSDMGETGTSLQRYLVANSGGSSRFSLPRTWYAVSFTEHADHLGQWRLYGADGHGFAVGMSSAVLAEGIPRVRGRLLPVIYEPARKRELARAALFGVAREVEQRLDDRADYRSDEHRSAFGKSAAMYAIALADRALAATFKAEAYASESEWRLVFSGPDPLHRLDEAARREMLAVKYRAAGQTIVPYLEIEGFGEPTTVVREVRTGPCQDHERATISLAGLVAREALQDVKVDCSTHQYRGKR